MSSDDELARLLRPTLAEELKIKIETAEEEKGFEQCGSEDKPFDDIHVPEQSFASNTVVLHTIKLLQHAAHLEFLISQVNKENEQDVQTVWPVAPQIPELSDLENDFKFLIKLSNPSESDMSSTKSVCIGPKNAVKILRKCIATQLLHVGYQVVTSSALDVLTDVVQDFLFKFVRLLRIAVDHESLNGSSGFPDVFERVFSEMGLGSIIYLPLFYHKTVHLKHETALKTCNYLMEKYAKLTMPIKKEPVADIVCKIETEDGDIPEIHFPAEEGYAVNELQPSLEPGFQMLHSLEQEEQLQNMEADEDVNVYFSQDTSSAFIKGNSNKIKS